MPKKKRKGITVAARKAKARRLQDLIVAGILRTFHFLSKDDVRPAIMGESGEDTKLSALARTCVPFTIEAKNQEAFSIWAAFEQAREHRSDYPPMVVFTRNHAPVYAAVEWEEMLKLLRGRWEQ